jgi:hypothetical protein
VDTPNPFLGKNYFSDGVAEIPPPFFLQRIYDFDHMLVILPSQMVPTAYVIARRRQFSAGLTDKAIEGSIEQLDTKKCLTLGCVPVCLMYKTGPVWNADTIVATLAARDLWAHGGADRVATMLEEQEEAERAKTRAATRDDIWNRSGDGWRSYQARTGASNLQFHDRFKLKLKPQSGTADVQTVPSGSTAGSGIVLTD